MTVAPLETSAAVMGGESGGVKGEPVEGHCDVCESARLSDLFLLVYL